MGRRLAKLSTCNLNQWALDFTGNLDRIKQSIDESKRQGASYRVLGCLFVVYGHHKEMLGWSAIDHPHNHRWGQSWRCQDMAVRTTLWSLTPLSIAGRPLRYDGACCTGKNRPHAPDHIPSPSQELIIEGYTDGLLCDIGMPVMHRGILFVLHVYYMYTTCTP